MRQVAMVLLLVAGVGCGGLVAWDGTTLGPGTIPGPVTPPSFDGLPCEVATVLQNRCTSCHGVPPSLGAPYSLASLADLQTLAPPPYGTQTRAQRSVIRMADAASPMPPGSAASAADQATLAAWVNAGMPSGTTCGPPTILCTGGPGSTSEEAKVNMKPGEACRACHLRDREAPHDAYMGTVYPTLHEKVDCNGAPPSPTALQVEILEPDGGAVLLRLEVSSPSGNFRSRGLTQPQSYRARVRNTLTGQVREMASTQTDGDCNVCHTELGASSAPGRIAWPN